MTDMDMLQSRVVVYLVLASTLDKHLDRQGFAVWRYVQRSDHNIDADWSIGPQGMRGEPGVQGKHRVIQVSAAAGSPGWVD